MNPVYVAQDDMATGAGCVEKGKSVGSGVWCLGKPFPLTSSEKIRAAFRGESSVPFPLTWLSPSVMSPN